MKKILFFIFFFSLSQINGQDINHFSFNKLYDFDVFTVYDINERDDYTMWFGTNKGLISFDGVNFTTYTNENFDIDYSNIKFDEQGRVWCTNFGGQLFYLEDDKLRLAVNWQNQGDFIRNYSLSKLPEIKILGTNTIDAYNLNAETPIEHENIFSVKRSKVFLMSDTAKENYAIYTSNDNNNNGKLKLYQPDKDPDKKNLEKIYDINIPSGKWDIFGDKEHLFIYHVDKAGKVYFLDKNDVQPILDNLKISTFQFNAIDFIENRIWLLTKNGIKLYNLNEEITNENAFEGISASSLHKDHEGNVWVGSLDQGLFIIPNLSFQNFKIGENSIVQSKFDADGNLFILDNKGSLYFLSQKDNFSKTKELAKNLEPAPLFFDQDEKKLFIGNFSTYYDCEKNRLIDKKAGKKNRFKEAISIDKGQYIFTDYSSAKCFSINNKPISFFTHNNTKIRNYRSKNIIATKDKNDVYIDYIDGLYYYAKQEEPSVVKWEKQDILVAEMIEDTEEENVIWIISKTKDLLKLKNGKIIDVIKIPFTAEEVALHNNYIFLASQQGIIRIDRDSREIQVIDETNGWIKSRVSSLKIINGICVIVGGKHIQKIPITFNPINEVVPKIHITKINDKAILTDQKQKGLTFPPDVNFIKFSFRSLSVKSQKKLSYQYRLANKNSNWIDSSPDKPEALFLNLESGGYMFEVRACNNSGFCSVPKTVNFSIEQPFYKKPWFVGIVTLLFFSLVFIVFQIRLKQKEKQERLKAERERLTKENYKSKIAAIRSQMNPHFMFNALNTIQEFILTNQQEIASEYLADFADLMRMYLNQSKEDEVSISTEEENLKLYLRLENLRFNDDLNYKVNIDPLINKDGTMIPVMLIQPYVENSIKHGLLHKKGEKNLDIRFQKFGDTGIKCIIEDNGIGRASSSDINASKTFKHKSFATNANESRIDMINQNREKKITARIIDLHHDGKPTGTRVEIVID